MRVISLFTGIGAHDLGLRWAGMEIVGQVEIDGYCLDKLETNFPGVKRWGDITTVTANYLRRLKPDLITGGFPCQDISTVGRQRGIVDGERSGLWREMWRIVRDVRPDWVLIENVPALRTKGADSVCSAMEAIGYTCRAHVVHAFDAGLDHSRPRVWIVAYSDRIAKLKPQVEDVSERARGDSRQDAGELRALLGKPARPGIVLNEWEPPRLFKPGMGYQLAGSAEGMALKALGNCNPPQVTAMLGRAIMRIHSQI